MGTPLSLSLLDPAAAYVVNNSANNMLALSAAGITFVAGNLSAEVGRLPLHSFDEQGLL